MFSLRKNSLKPLFLMALCALPLFSQNTAESNEPVCAVRGIEGTVQIRMSKARRERAAKADGKAGWTEARLNMALREKDAIRTMAQSQLRLETPDGSRINFGENTTAEIVTLRYRSKNTRTRLKITGRAVSGQEPKTDVYQQIITTANTKIRLTNGSMAANVRKFGGKKSNFEIETPTAVVVVAGGAVVELEARDDLTVVSVFDGKALVAPAGTKLFAEVNYRHTVDVASNQKTLTVREIPGGRNPKSAGYTDESGGLSLKLYDMPDTISSYAGDSIAVRGVVTPPTAKVRVNNRRVVPDAAGGFTVVFNAPSDSGVYPLRISANSGGFSETVLRTVKVGHVFTEVKLASPIEGQIVAKPSVEVSGTAAPGSKVNVLGESIYVNRSGTFSAKVDLPHQEGEVKLEIEIVDKENNAVWFVRNVKYEK